MKEGTVIQPRVLQLNLDNINRLPHVKYPERKKIGGMCRCGNRTYDLIHSACKAGAKNMPLHTTFDT